MFEGNLCGFTLIVANQFGGVQANKAPSPPFLSEVSNLFGKYGGSGQLTGMPWTPPWLDLKHLGSPPTFKAPECFQAHLLAMSLVIIIAIFIIVIL